MLREWTDRISAGAVHTGSNDSSACANFVVSLVVETVESSFQ